MRPPANSTSINFGALTHKIHVNNRITDNLFKQGGEEFDRLVCHVAKIFKIIRPYTRSTSNLLERLFGLPLQKQETLSRYSFLGPNGLHGQWMEPRDGIKVGHYEPMAVKDSILKVVDSTMESILSVFNGRWLHPTEDPDPPLNNELENYNSQLGNIRQPSPPPVLPELKPELLPISPTIVADSSPGPSKLSEDGLPSSGSLHDLHVPKKMMEKFSRLALENTAKDLETCGILAGSLQNRAFHVTTLIIPKQESTSYSCQTLNEEELFEVQDMHSLFPLGWIHTHPTQTCFMSSVDLHTHYSYQVMLPEAIAIVMAPMDLEFPCGIFHLCDPCGIAVIRTCDLRGFHLHEEPDDFIYENCSHVHLNPDSEFDVIDLR